MARPRVTTPLCQCVAVWGRHLCPGSGLPRSRFMATTCQQRSRASPATRPVGRRSRRPAPPGPASSPAGPARPRLSSPPVQGRAAIHQVGAWAAVSASSEGSSAKPQRSPSLQTRPAVMITPELQTLSREDFLATECFVYFPVERCYVVTAALLISPQFAQTADKK